MPAELYILMTAICLGAMLQVGVGIGFSIIAGPPMMIMLGTPTAVPILLLLNTVVSAVATDWHVLKNNQQLIVTAVIGCCVGVAAGRIVYPFLSEAFVLALTACLLLIGLITTLLPLRGFIGNVGFSTVTGLSGLATIWAATPGPTYGVRFDCKGSIRQRGGKAGSTNSVGGIWHRIFVAQSVRGTINLVWGRQYGGSSP